ncbi:MAG: hypothetical protein IPK04_00360 [Bdellovibrionales bacterium]|nr:hypothetical protein [Bdellovibrionales bacterium]
MQSIKLFRLLASVMFLLVSTLSTGPGAGVWVGVGTGDLAWGEDNKTNAATSGGGSIASGRTRRGQNANKTPPLPQPRSQAYVVDAEGNVVTVTPEENVARTRREALRTQDANRQTNFLNTRNKCDADRKALDESMAKCKGKCLADMKRCNDSATGGSYVVSELLSAWAGPDFGSTLESTKCDLSPAQWETDKAKLEKEIEESEKNLLKLNKDIVENEDKYKALIQELNKKLPAEKKETKEKGESWMPKCEKGIKNLEQQNKLNLNIRSVVDEQKRLGKR